MYAIHMHRSPRQAKQKEALAPSTALALQSADTALGQWPECTTHQQWDPRRVGKGWLTRRDYPRLTSARVHDATL